MARSRKPTNPKTPEHLDTAKAEAAVIPLWQLRAAQSAMRKFEQTGSGVHLFPAVKLVAPTARWDTPTMAMKLNELLEANASRLAPAH